ncbi:MAG: hypothetical protein A4E64_01840 [Syntrophorhabdus sp. PtaU1.Bin058]|nr:MAG: hypothetical protein A4E64_01840 [Syntrophorhabdus sp. PtaU1.Bin058]
MCADIVVLEVRQSGQRSGDIVKFCVSLEGVSDLRAICRPDPRIFCKLIEEPHVPSGAPCIAFELYIAVGVLCRPYEGPEIDGVGQYRIDVADIHAPADTELLVDPVGDGRVDIDIVQVRFDGVVSADPPVVIFGGQTERGIYAYADGKPVDLLNIVKVRSDLCDTGVPTVVAAK